MFLAGCCIYSDTFCFTLNSDDVELYKVKYIFGIIYYRLTNY